MKNDPMPASPWLSVLVPVYGVERYLEACVASVLAQGSEGIEVILLDDASPDGSGQIADQLQLRHPGVVHALSHPRNRGVSAARNTLLAAARGRYLWFLDADDELLPGALAGLRAIIEAEAPDLVLCDFSVLRERSGWRQRLAGETHRRSHTGDGGRLSADRDVLVCGLLQSRQLHAWSKIATREVWRSVTFPEGRYFEDIAVISQLVAAVKTWRHAPLPWVGYRQHGDSILATMTPRKIHDHVTALCELHDGLLSLPGGLGAHAQFALDYFCLRAFANLARTLPPDDPALVRACRQAMAAVFPEDGIARALKACRRHGWWLRAIRIQRSLARRGWLQ